MVQTNISNRCTTPPGGKVHKIWDMIGLISDCQETSPQRLVAPPAATPWYPLEQVGLNHSGLLISVIGCHDDTLVISDPFGH